MRIVSGFANIFFGFIIMLIGILIGCTIIGLLFAFPIASFGVAKMGQGMVQIGMGTHAAVQGQRDQP